MEDSLQLNLHVKCEESLPLGAPEMEASMVSLGIRSGAPSTEARAAGVHSLLLLREAC